MFSDPGDDQSDQDDTYTDLVDRYQDPVMGILTLVLVIRRTLILYWDLRDGSTDPGDWYKDPVDTYTDLGDRYWNLGYGYSDSG